jgi:hypothetical protein
MSESKIHVLPDENSGGVLREYVEVDRPAKEGDLIVVYDGSDIYEDITIGKPYPVHKTFKSIGGDDYIKFYDDAGDERVWDTPSEDYAVIEPTDIVHIDGARYRLVDRKARVGEKVIIVETHPSLVYTELGEIVEIIETDGDTCGGMFKPHDIGEKGAVYRFQYRVLEPVEPAEEGDDVLTVDETEASKSVLDLLANLARRVTELERKLSEYARKIDGIEADIQNINIDLGTVEANVEMALDDIVTLDERTQPLAAVLSALAKAVKADE